MTEINPKQGPLGKVSPTPDPKSSQVTKGNQAEAFSKILQARLNPGLDLPASDNEVGDSQSGLAELDATYTARLAKLTGAFPQVTDQISSSIDLLETYAQWLSDPEKTTRQALGLLEEIDASIMKLDKEPAGAADPRLKNIVDHLSTLVAVEKVKLNRGDYN